MKCTRIRKVILTADFGELPPAIARHLESCPHCSHLYRQGIQVHQLVALKRYETPEPFACERCLNQFRHRSAPVSGRGVRSLTLVGVPTAATGVAAACLALIGLQLHYTASLPSLNSTITGSGVRSLEEFLADGHGNGFQPYFEILPTDDLSFSNSLAIPRRPGVGSTSFVSE